MTGVRAGWCVGRVSARCRAVGRPARVRSSLPYAVLGDRVSESGPSRRGSVVRSAPRGWCYGCACGLLVRGRPRLDRPVLAAVGRGSRPDRPRRGWSCYGCAWRLVGRTQGVRPAPRGGVTAARAGCVLPRGPGGATSPNPASLAARANGPGPAPVRRGARKGPGPHAHAAPAGGTPRVGQRPAPRSVALRPGRPAGVNWPSSYGG